MYLLRLARDLFRAPGELDLPLDVEIADDRTVRVARVHRDCTIWMFNEQYLIKLVSIPLFGNKVIVSMDWLRPNEAVVDCEQQLVQIRTPSWGELMV